MTDDVEKRNYQESLEYAGQCAGEYLESINVTDMADMSQEQWMTFLDVVVRNHATKMLDLPPF